MGSPSSEAFGWSCTARMRGSVGEDWNHVLGILTTLADRAGCGPPPLLRECSPCCTTPYWTEFSPAHFPLDSSWPLPSHVSARVRLASEMPLHERVVGTLSKDGWFPQGQDKQVAGFSLASAPQFLLTRRRHT